MNSFLPSDELLSAYLDGEATAQERELVERALGESPAVRRSLEELRRLQTEMRGLPRLRLEPDFCDQVLRQAQRTMLLGETPEHRSEHQVTGITSPLEAAPVEAGPTHKVGPVEEILRSVQDAPDPRRFLARSSDATRRGGWQRGTWQRVAAALAVLVPSLALIILATRDPRSGGSPVTKNQVARTEPAKGSEADEDMGEARDRSMVPASEATTKFGDHLDREHVNRDHVNRDHVNRELPDGLADAPGSSFRKAESGNAPAADFSGEAAAKQSETPPAAANRDAPGGADSEFRARATQRHVEKGGAAKSLEKGIEKSVEESASRSGTVPRDAPAGNNGLGSELEGAQLVENETFAARSESAQADGVLVVHLSVTEEAWRSGAVNKRLAAYESPANRSLRSGKLGAEHTSGRVNEKAADDHKAVEERAVEKKADERTPEERKPTNGPIDEKIDERIGEKIDQKIEKKAEGLAANQDASGKQRAGDKATSDKSASADQMSIVQVEGTAADMYSLLTDLSAQAKARGDVVSLAVVPPRQADRDKAGLDKASLDQAGQYQRWSAFNYAAGIKQGVADTFAEFDQPASPKSGSAAGGPRSGGLGGGGVGSVSPETAERYKAEGQSRAEGKARSLGSGAFKATDGQAVNQAVRGGAGPIPQVTVKEAQKQPLDGRELGKDEGDVKALGDEARRGDAYDKEKDASKWKEKLRENAKPSAEPTSSTKTTSSSQTGSFSKAALPATAGEQAAKVENEVKAKSSANRGAVDPTTLDRRPNLGTFFGGGQGGGGANQPAAGGPAALLGRGKLPSGGVPSPAPLEAAPPGAGAAAGAPTGAASAKSAPYGQPGEAGFGFDPPASGPASAAADRTQRGAGAAPVARREAAAPAPGAPALRNGAPQNGAVPARRLRAIFIVQVAPTARAAASKPATAPAPAEAAKEK